MKKYLLYIDILGFKELVAEKPRKIEMLYGIIDSLNVHAHHAFKTIVFSDTILVYNSTDPATDTDRDYFVMYACEFAQDLQHRLVGQDIYFRAVLVLGDFDHYFLKNIECFYGAALIKAYIKEKDIPAIGLFIDDASNGHNNIFPTIRFDSDLSFVFLNQSLERLQKNTEGKLPTDSFHLSATEEYWEILWDVRFLKDVYSNMQRQHSTRIRTKYLTTWHIFRRRYPKILDALESRNFSPRAICENFDWTKRIESFKESLAHFRSIGGDAQAIIPPDLEHKAAQGR